MQINNRSHERDRTFLLHFSTYVRNTQLVFRDEPCANYHSLSYAYTSPSPVHLCVPLARSEWSSQRERLLRTGAIFPRNMFFPGRVSTYDVLLTKQQLLENARANEIRCLPNGCFLNRVGRYVLRSLIYVHSRVSAKLPDGRVVNNNTAARRDRRIFDARCDYSTDLMHSQIRPLYRDPALFINDRA